MDMSVKLNQSYPAVAPQGVTPNVAGKPEQPKIEAVKPLSSEPKRDELEKAVTDIQEFVQAAQRNRRYLDRCQRRCWLLRHCCCRCCNCSSGNWCSFPELHQQLLAERRWCNRSVRSCRYYCQLG